jgi:N,N'-diacetyllegionaminate synthase
MSTAMSPRSDQDRLDQVYIIAEMACSHEGNPSLARAIIDAAGTAKANAIQFQVWSLADMVVPHHPDYPMLGRIELARQSWADMFSYARERHPSMQIIACVYERGSVDFCERHGADAYKIHSADLSNPYLIEHVAQTGKRIDLSIGASTITEIQTAIQWIEEAGSARVPAKSNIWLMYGYQGFPTPPEAINLNYMRKLQELFELPVGYQDHSGGDTEAAFWLPAAAVGMGIDILEKHITHDRSLKGIDHEAALDPDEFARFVYMVRQLEAARGCPTPRPFSEEEVKYRKYSKKSVVAGRDLPKETIIGIEDLRFMRADALGFPPDQADHIVGRMTKHAIPAFALITEDDLS